MQRAQAHPGPEPSGVRSWVDPSARIPGKPARWSPCLTAKLQLQPSPQPSREPPRGCLWPARELCPERPREGHSAVLVEPRSTAPPRSAYRPRCSRPRSGLATLPLTSLLAILRGPGRSLSEGPHPHRIESPYPAPPRPRQRPRPFAGPGRLPSPSAPSPCRASRFRVPRMGSPGARHRYRCSRARGFRHRDPASGARSRAELPEEPAG